MGTENLHTNPVAAMDGSATGPRHSRELAHQLVRRLGVQGATRTCIENHWQGVLDIIQAMNHKQ